MGSLGSVGAGFPHQGMPELKKTSPPPLAEQPEQLEQHHLQNLEDESKIACLPSSAMFPRPDIRSAGTDEETSREPRHPGVHIGVCNGMSIEMRVNYKGEAEYNCENSGWSKSPPLSLSKSRIRMALDTLRHMGIDVKEYEKSLGSYDSNSAPVSLLAEDDIDHSMGLLQTMHNERSQPAGRKRTPQINGPLFIANPEFESQFGVS